MVQPALPLELVSAILDIIWHNTIHGWPDKRTLSACCLVSKSFLPLARARLYRTLTFAKFSATTPQRTTTSLTEQNLRRLLDYRTSCLRDTLFYRPEFGVHVEDVRITIDCDDTRPHLGDEISAQILDELRSRCPHLQRVCLGPASHGSLQTNRALGRYGSQLRVLEYDETHDWSKEWFEMLCALPKLERLHRVTYGTLPDDHIDPPSIELTSFSGYDELDQDFLLLLLRNSHATLTTLSIPSQSTEGRAWDLSPFVALQSLDLILGFGEAVGPGDDPDNCVLFTVGTCPPLLSLHLSTWLDHPKVWEIEDEVPFLHLLPSTLRTLSLGDVQISDQNLLEPLADSTILPSLRTLVLGDSTQVGDMDEDHDTPSWQSVRREAPVISQVEELCEARAIQLTWDEWAQGQRGPL